MIGLIGQGVGMGLGARAQAASARGEEAVHLYNAKVQEREAVAQGQAASFKQGLQAQEADRLRSTQQAIAGTSGAVSDVGTPLLIQAEQAEQSELDNLLIGYEGIVGAQRSRSQAKLDLFKAGLAHEAGEQADIIKEIFLPFSKPTSFLAPITFEAPKLLKK
jgi:hypothetical protein